MAERIWEELLKIIEQEVGNHVVQTWLKVLMLKGWDAAEGIVYLQVPNVFIRSWVQTHYQSLLETHLARLLALPVAKIQFVFAAQAPENEITTIKPIIPAVVIPHLNSVVLDKNNDAMVKTAYHTTNQSYVFDTFVVGPSNQLAYAAAHAVTEKLGKLYNPLFIYGGSGLGKTHLLHAIGNKIKEQNRRSEVLYQTADRFVSEFIGAIRFDKVHQFKTRYKDVDLLLIDDVQFISNKEQTQEAFFHIFNMLYESHKQIVFSSDTDPAGINGLADRLRSRFEWGLVADIGLPTLETKIAILQKKSIASRLAISADVINYIASSRIFNVRELEGALIRVMAFASLSNQPITLETAKKVLSRIKRTNDQHVDFRHIIRSVQKHCGISITAIRSTKRTKNLVFARHLGMYLMKKLTNRSLEQIGDFFGGKDHSTVLHAIAKIEDGLSHDKKLATLIATIEDELQNG